MTLALAHPKISAVSSPVVFASVKGSLLQQGKQLYDRQQYLEALAPLLKSVAAHKARGDKLGMAIAYGNLSLVYQQLGQWQAAEQAVTKSIDLLPTSASIDSESASVLAQILDIKGRLYLKQGQDRAALRTWQRSATISLQLEDRVGVMRSQLNQAQAMNSLGMYFQAEKTLADTARQIQQEPDSTLKATVLLSLGNVYRGTGNLAQSARTLERSLAVAKASQSNTGNIRLSQGNTALAQSKPKDAANFYRQAIDNTDSVFVRIKAQLNYLGLLKQKNAPQIRRLVRAIESQLKNLPLSNEVISARINLAETLQRLNTENIAFSQAKLIKILTEAKQQAEELENPRAMSYALGNLAEIYADKGQGQLAIDLTQSALFWGQTVSAAELTYRWQWQLGRLQKEAGNIPEAIAAYTEAVNDLQSLRGNLAGLDPKLQFYFRERVKPVYTQLVDLLLQPQPNQANLIAARQTIESLQLVELENYFRQACLEPQTDIDKIVDTDSSTVVIYPIVLPDRLEIIVKSQNSQLLHFTSEVKSEKLQTIASKLREDLLDVSKTASVKDASQQLYRYLIEPLETALTTKNIDTLVFVLDGSLRNIPMSVLYDAQQQQYLVEKYAIATAPGLQLVEPSFAPSKLNVLTAGISQARTIEAQNFSPLINVEQELQQIQSQVSKSKQIINREFTQDNFQALLERTNFSTVHLATHGKFSSNPEQTFILTWNKLLKTQDLADLIGRYNLSSEKAIELLVLSACETATGDSLATLGLAGVAVKAGVKSTIASLWTADDRYSSEIMNGFYQELSLGVTKAKALQKAQISVLQQEDRPYLWSSFILLGNWL